MLGVIRIDHRGQEFLVALRATIILWRAGVFAAYAHAAGNGLIQLQEILGLHLVAASRRSSYRL